MALTQLTDLQPTNIKVTGIATFDQTVGIAGTLTYEDVTNVDSVGIVTARNGINVSGGTGTFAGNVSIADKIVHTGDTDTAIRFHANDTVSVETGGSQQVTIGANVNIISGELTIPDTIRHRNDSNTKIRFPADDTVTVETAGGERVRITSTGKVGINSTSPTYALEVDGGTQNTVIVARSSDAKAAISFLDNTTGGYGRATIGGEGTEVYITSGTGGDERLRIDSSGHVRVNTGDLRVGDETDSNAGTQTISVGSVSSGSGGIGIFANPTNGNSFVQFGDGTSSADQYRGYMNYRHADDSLRFGTAGSDRLLINSSGYVTKPAHPSFCARFTSGNGFSGDILVLTKVDDNYLTWNNGSHYSTSTGKFTAPVAGFYYFEGQVMATGFSNGTNIQDMVQIRSSQGLVSHPRQRRTYFRTEDDANGYYTNSASGQVKLAAGDTVWFQRNGGGSWSYSNTNYTYFTGWLIG